jgi:error-prone DNA polymerase
VENLIFAGAFDTWGLPRRHLAWALTGALEQARTPAPLVLSDEVVPDLPPLSPSERLQAEVAYTGISAHAPLTALVERQFDALGVSPSDDLPRLRDGAKVRVGGVIVSRQQPPTARGILFLALEDAAGVLNVVLRPEISAAYRQALTAPFVVIEGVVQRRHQALSVVANRVLPVWEE